MPRHIQKGWRIGDMRGNNSKKQLVKDFGVDYERC